MECLTVNQNKDVGLRHITNETFSVLQTKKINIMISQDEIDLHEICIQSQRIYSVITNNKLYTIWELLSKTKLSKESKISSREVNWRRNDLYLDIHQFYKIGKQNISKFIEDFNDMKNGNAPLANFRQTVKKFKVYVKRLKRMMIDLDERITLLMLEMNSKSERRLFCRTPTSTQIAILTQRCEEFVAIFEVKKAERSEIAEIFRLNRRMAVILKDSSFIILSKLQAIDSKIIKLIMNTDVIYQKDTIYDIFCRNAHLKADLNTFYTAFIKSCKNNVTMFEDEIFVMSFLNDSKNPEVSAVENLKTYFETIEQKLNAFDGKYKVVRDMLEKVSLSYKH